MSKLEIIVSCDIKDKRHYLTSIVDAVGDDKICCPDSIIMVCSNTAASFMEIIGTLASWKPVLVASATVFFSTLSKRLADELYDKKEIIAGELFNQVRLFIKKVFEAKNKISSDLPVRFIISEQKIPDLVLFLTDESEKEAAFKFACFYALSDKIIDKVSFYLEKYNRSIGYPVISVSEIGVVTVSFYGGMNNEYVEFTVSLHDVK